MLGANYSLPYLLFFTPNDFFYNQSHSPAQARLKNQEVGSRVLAFWSE